MILHTPTPTIHDIPIYPYSHVSIQPGRLVLPCSKRKNIKKNLLGAIAIRESKVDKGKDIDEYHGYGGVEYRVWWNMEYGV